MMHVSVLRAAALAAALAPVLALPPNAAAGGNSTFYGITVHVSSSNIKVQDPKTKETLSFVIVPKFDQVFSANGKTTYQMTAIKAGQYVGIIYDQRALGVRHADKIYLLTNANQRIGSQ
jgi:opacity protein-like surface antigen